MDFLTILKKMLSPTYLLLSVLFMGAGVASADTCFVEEPVLTLSAATEEDRNFNVPSGQFSGGINFDVEVGGTLTISHQSGNLGDSVGRLIRLDDDVMSVVAENDDRNFTEEDFLTGNLDNSLYFRIDRAVVSPGPHCIDVRAFGGEPSVGWDGVLRFYFTPQTNAPQSALASNLRAEVYSPTTAELFWNAPTDGSSPTYEITLFGQLVDTVSGHSFYAPDLFPGVDYEFSVTTVLADGARSAPLELTVRTGDFPEPTSTDLPNFGYEVYSSTAAELFWDAPTNDRNYYYDIFRNGFLIASIDGRSYFDASLEPGRRYDYEVLAFDDFGSLAFGFISFNTTGEPVNPLPTPNPGALQAPANLTFLVYSSSTVELFWDDPVDGITIGYEIYRNGEFLFNLGGRSFLDTELISGVDYTYELYALDASSNRSTASRVIINTDPAATVTGVSPPRNVRSLVYSSTAAELFWEPSEFGAVQAYEIVRDGELVATFDGRSYFDDSLVSGQGYLYEITALDGNGVRSDTVLEVVDTSGF